MHMSRPTDRLFCCELHPQEFNYLQHLTHAERRVFHRQVDGITQMNALLPPMERRGLIFIDPSYERKQEYRDIPLAILDAHTQI